MNVGHFSQSQIRTLQWIILAILAMVIAMVEAFRVVVQGIPITAALIELSLGLILGGGLIYLCFAVFLRGHERAVQLAEQIAAFNAVAVTTGQRLQLSEILNRSLEKVLQATGAEQGAIHLLDEPAQALQLAAWRGGGDGVGEAEQATVRIGEGPLGTVVRTGAPVVSTQESGDGPSQVRRTVSVPLQAKGNVLGTLQIVIRQPADFNDNRMTLLTAMASQIAVAVDNARLYAQMQAQAARHQQGQERVLRAVRLATAGELAGGVAHEINNPLAVILGTAQLMLQSPELPPNLLRDVELVINSAERIATIIRGFTELTQASNSHHGPVDVNQVVHAASQNFDERLRQDNISLWLELAPQISLVSGNPGQLEQVLRRLLTNAVEAVMSNGGAGWIRVTTQHLGAQVVIAVADSGLGIRPADLPRVFEPGFTTKVTAGTVRGIGLGLFTAQAIVQAHNGTIEVDSTPGEGTTFVIRLPALPE